MAVQNQQVLSHAACWPSADERVNCESMVNVWSSVCTHTFVCSAIASQVSPALPSSTRPTITCISDLIAYLTVFYTCQVEYERVKEAYVNMTHSLEASAAEKRALEVRLGQAAADASRDARERRCACLISCGTEKCSRKIPRTSHHWVCRWRQLSLVALRRHAEPATEHQRMRACEPVQLQDLGGLETCLKARLCLQLQWQHADIGIPHWYRAAGCCSSSRRTCRARWRCC